MRQLFSVVCFIFLYGPISRVVEESPIAQALLKDILESPSVHVIWPALVMLTVFGLVEVGSKVLFGTPEFVTPAKGVVASSTSMASAVKGFSTAEVAKADATMKKA